MLKNSSYVVKANYASRYEWAVTGDITMTFSQADTVVIIHTGPTFTSGSVRARGQRDIVWSGWVSIPLSISYHTGRSSDASSDVNEIESTESIYPNPLKSGDLLHVSLASNSEVSSVFIGDALGNILETIDNVVGDQLELPTHALAPGLYTLRISSASGVRVRKFQVQ